VKQRLLGLPVIGTALRVQDRYVRDAADPLAAAIAFFGFLSLFPLLLLAISVTGFVLQDPADQLAVAERLTEAIPGFEQTVQGEEGSQVAELLENVVAQRGTIGAVGLVVLLFSGLRVINAAMVSTRVVFRGPVLLGVRKRLRQVLALVALGTLALTSTGASSFAGIGLGFVPSGISVLLSSGVSFVLDVGLFLAAYTFLAPSAVLSVRDRLPGAVLAGAGWTALKIVGATWVGSQIASANALYGALGSVIALMLLFYLAGRLYLYGAVLSAVRYEAVHGPLIAPHEREELGVAPHEREELGAEPSERDTATSDGTAAGRGRRVGSPRPLAGPDADGPPRPLAGPDADGPPPPLAGPDADGTPRPLAGPDADGPPPRPRDAGGVRPTDPGPQVAAATISPATRTRLAAADAVDAEPGAGGRDTRTALGFALAVGALVAGWRFLGGRDR
jgi:membrane protein